MSPPQTIRRVPSSASRRGLRAVLDMVFPRGVSYGLLCGVLLWGEGCKELTGSPGLPAGTPNPSIYNNATGAVEMRNAAVYGFESALSGYVIEAGLLTDELQDNETGASAGVLFGNSGVQNALDERILPQGGENFDVSYLNLQNARAYSAQALGALAAYDTAVADTAQARVSRGELYAFEGYAEIMLADLFCSGVPLSTLTFQGDFSYAAGSTTDQVYQDAIAKFDTALVLGRGSDSVVHLAQVGLGRAYLARGSRFFAAAADDVAGVPAGFQYGMYVQFPVLSNCTPLYNEHSVNACTATVSDREGIHGLPYLMNGVSDQRTATSMYGTDPITGKTLYLPAKYQAAQSGSNFAPFVLASGIEARLIEAEYLLQANPASSAWLDTLNALRTNAVFYSNGGVQNLDALSDPGATLSGTTASIARVQLLFQERAYWLFMDGHRQGDLRRLLREYNALPSFQSQSQVYPTGAYLAPGTGQYGDDVTVPIPSTEVANPYFTGCKDRNP